MGNRWGEAKKPLITFKASPKPKHSKGIVKSIVEGVKGKKK